MIVRISFLSTLFVLICACGTSQGPIFQDALNTPSFTYNKLSDTERDRLSAEIKLKYDKLLGNRGFSGQILVAKNGEIIFEDYKGYSNLSQKSPIIPETPIHLASVSKTFTGMVAMKLWEQEKLDLKAPITKYLPNFPYTEVTIEQLLSHRSGLPDYTYFMESRKYVSVKVKTKRGRWVKKLKLIQNEKPFREGNYTNQDVLDYMVQKRPAPAANPDRVFRYCNTNYVLLALIIEKVTGKDFPTYMDETVFKPLNMTNSYIFSAKTIEKYTPSYNARMQPYRIEKYDCIYGDKNVYSTVRDLYLWDKALTEGVFLRPETLELAYQPQSPTNKYYHNYGFGWRILVKPNEEKLIYHNGWWHGNNTVFNRMIGETATIIILGNKFNKTIYKGKELGSVFTGKLDTTSLVE
jgi:CubicO group peptidase (beta-lactamase class C family)